MEYVKNINHHFQHYNNINSQWRIIVTIIANAHQFFNNFIRHKNNQPNSIFIKIPFPSQLLSSRISLHRFITRAAPPKRAAAPTAPVFMGAKADFVELSPVVRTVVSVFVTVDVSVSVR